MNPKSFNKLLLIIISVTALGVSFVVYMYWGSLSKISGEVSEKEIALESFTDKERSLENLRANYQKIEENTDEILTALPNTKDIPGFISNIEALAKEKDITVTTYEYKKNAAKKKERPSATGEEAAAEEGTKNLSLLQAEKEGDLYKVPLEVLVGGKYSKVLSYIKDLENLSRIIIVNKIEITKEDEGEDVLSYDKVQATINMEIYLKK